MSEFEFISSSVS